MKYFTYLWTSKTWKSKASQSPENMLTYAASDLFTSAKVSPGCTVFIVTVKAGLCYLGGFIKVGAVTDKAGAAEHLGIAEEELWDGKEYILAKEGTEVPFNADRVLDPALSRGLEFAKDGGFINLKLDSEGKLNPQTLRGVRQLYNGEEKKLMALINS